MQRLVQLLGFLLLSAVLFGCRSATPQPAGVSYVVTASGFELGTTEGQVRIRRVIDGAIVDIPVDNATVTVNGMDYQYDAGIFAYERSSGAAWSAGDELTLQVTIDDASIIGSATVPGLANQTSPGDGHVFTPDEVITLAWDLAGDPDRYSVTFSWAGDNFQVPLPDGSARQVQPDLALLPLDTSVRAVIRAIGDGSFTGPVHEYSAFTTSSSTDLATAPSFSISTAPPVPDALFVSGTSMSAKYNHIIVMPYFGDEIGTPSGEATAILNGTPMTMTSAGRFSLELATAVPVGGSLNLEVTMLGLTVTATGTVAEHPVVTAPAHGSIFGPTDTVTVEWTSGMYPDHIKVALYAEGSQHADVTGLPGDTRSQAFDLAELSTPLPANPWHPTVFYFMDGNFTGPAHPDSSMNIRSDSIGWLEFTITP